MEAPQPASSSDVSSEFFKSLPRAYVNQLHEGLPEKVILNDETGKNSHVRLEKIDEDLCFTTGWAEFVRDHYLVGGDFLIFKYSGNSLFHVKIFGTDACKKKVLDHIDHGIGRGHDHVMKVKQENVEEGNEVTHNVETEKSTGPSKGFRGRKRKIATTNLQEQCRVQKKATKCSVSPTNYNPLHFAVTITYTYRYSLHVPKSFLKAAHDDDVEMKSDLLLRFNNKKNKWPVKMTIWKDGRCSMNGGWGEFMRNNNIKVNDKCVFKALLGDNIGTSNRICEEMQVHVVNQRVKN
ncbi:hypothetical protein FNV43_RR00299 [Rhamnella rubrinervis]|uniref:TF-B3 domain-containing protein n=1 Tax=Rhamnella rubrinervis TaxID=2594499 RepID=A0A8K0MRS6_9ROSA|nr:hypothetical protein FNV43_RR00299 [Rhamnella rubrinervis]